MILQEASLVLLVISAFILAMTEREKITARKKAPKAERKKGVKDLLVLAERQLSSLEFGMQAPKQGTVKWLGDRRVRNE
jgi:hypothetical protein